MPINEDRPTELFIPQGNHPNRFRFMASKALAALKDYDCRTTTTKDKVYGNVQHTPQGDYIQILQDDPAACVFACHLKAICSNAPKDQIINAEYSTDGLILSYDNTRFLLKWQAPGKNAFIAVLHNGDAPDKTTPPDAWLKRACSKDKKRPEELLPVWGNMATDGYRVHYDTRLEPSNPPFPRDISFIMDPARLNSNIATIRVKPFIQAIKQARVINKDVLRLSFNGRLELIAKSEELGDSIIPLVSGYEHAGDDCIIGIHPAFLLDALAGFDNEVYFCMADNTPEKRPVYITDGTREAVIMPMKLL
jgi:hypothetical protein